MTRVLRGRAIEEWSGCLYDGPADVEALTREEEAALRAEATAEESAETFEFAGAGRRFRVVTKIRSKNFGPSLMRSPYAIVLHHTGGRFASDIVTLTEPGKAWGGKSVSSNDYITKDGTIYELVEFPKKAWHALAWNSQGWGIEIENTGGRDDPYPKAQVDAVVWRCRERRKKLGIDDPRRLFRHRDVQRGKPDTSDTFPYAEVRRRIFAATDVTDGAPRPIRNGDLIRRRGHATVYLVDDGRRREIPGASTFESQQWKWGDVRDVDGAVLDRFPEGEPFPAVADPIRSGDLVRARTARTIYVVERGRRRAIPDARTLEAHWDWHDVRVLPREAVKGVPLGTPYPASG